MRKPLQRHWCQVCRLSIRLNYRLTWVANPRGKTEGKTECVFKLCFCILFSVSLELGLGVKALRQKRVCFLYLFGLKECLSKKRLAERAVGLNRREGTAKFLPLLMKLICKSMWHNYSNSAAYRFQIIFEYTTLTVTKTNKKCYLIHANS